jgi:hypothetical protein
MKGELGLGGAGVVLGDAGERSVVVDTGKCLNKTLTFDLKFRKLIWLLIHYRQY